MLKKILSNGYLPIIPIIAWNIALTSKLPVAFNPAVFNHDIPWVISVGENLFRSIIFIMPLFFQLNISTAIGKKGFFVFLLGTFLYFLSWLVLIYFPEFIWSSSVWGFCAPAYTPLIWLLGLSFMAESYYFKVLYRRWHFILPSMLFLFFHVSHAVSVYARVVGVRY